MFFFGGGLASIPFIHPPPLPPPAASEHVIFKKKLKKNPTQCHSYRQARSLQEHARRWHDDHHQQQQQQQQQGGGQSPLLLYYYTLDLRGEPCALHGQILDRQAAFVHRALEAIAARHSPSPSGLDSMMEAAPAAVPVLVVGHSYGGMVAKGGVARALAAVAAAAGAEGKGEGGAKRALHVPILLTLGSPHQR